MTNLYDKFMYPLEKNWLGSKRESLMKSVSGDVLEIGFGTGVNLKYIDCNFVNSFTVIDLDINGQKEKCNSSDIKFIKGVAEELPFDDNSFDTVIETLVLCSVNNLDAVISEIMRVLKPGGQFIYMDHVLPENPVLATVFHGINVFWPHIASGCNVTREPHLLIEKQPVHIVESGHMAKSVFRYGIVKKINKTTNL